MKSLAVVGCCRLILAVLLWVPFKAEAQNELCDTSVAGVMVSKGWDYIGLRNDSSAMLAENAIRIYRCAAYGRGYLQAYLLWIEAQKYQGNYLKAINLALDLNNLARTLHNDEVSAEALCTLGELNRACMQYSKGIMYLHDALRYFKATHNRTGIARCFNRLAAINFEMRNFEQADLYCDSSILLLGNTDNYKLITSNLEIKGATLNARGKMKEALPVFSMAEKMLIENKMISDLPNLYRNMALSYFYMGDHTRSAEIAMKGFELALKNKTMVYVLSSALQLSIIYRKLENYEKAYRYLAIADSMRARLFREDQDAVISQLNTEYEKARNKHAYEKLKNENIAKEAVINQQRVLVAGIIILVVILSFFLFNMYIRGKELDRLNRKLGEQNIEIEQQKNQLELAYQNLRTLKEFKENMTGMIIHDLKNYVGIIMYEEEVVDPDQYPEMVRQTARQMYALIMNIMDVQKLENKMMKLDQSPVNLYQLAANAARNLDFLIRVKGIRISNSIDPELFANADAVATERVLVNLIDNAVKFSPQGGLISLRAEAVGKMTKVLVSDQGTGISEKDSREIFRKYYQAEKRKSGASHSTGLGLTFCRLAIEEQGGSIGVLVTDGPGATLWFTLPLAE